jgi:calmodulin
MENRLIDLASRKDQSPGFVQKKFARWVQEGPPGFSTFIFLAALGTCANMIVYLVNNHEDYLRMIICVYLAFFSLIIAVMELTVCCMTKGCKFVIEKWARFLSRLWGRSLFYIYVGTVQTSLLETSDIVLGLIFVILGLIGIFISRSTASKMKKLQTLIRKNNTDNDPVKIRRMFDLYDKDKSGYIDRKELYELSVHLGFPLERAQLDSAMKILDKDRNGRIEFEEFLHWWSGSGKMMA